MKDDLLYSRKRLYQGNCMKPISYQLRISVPGSHPSLPGHFPGNPIVPGVVILDHVLAALQDLKGDVQLDTLPVVKFLEPIYPDEEFIITLETGDNHRFRFHCMRDDRLKVSGELRVWLVKRD